MSTPDPYAFVFKGLLAEEALDKAGRAVARRSDDIRLAELEGVLALTFVDDEFRVPARERAVVYTAIASFENFVRSLVKKVLLDEYKLIGGSKELARAFARKPSRVSKKSRLSNGTRIGATVRCTSSTFLSSIASS
ncbi:MAG: hypothetical protein ABI145_10645 [Steroidobacteraceae bacterium]